MNPWLLILIVISILFLLLMFIPIRYKLGFAYHDNLNSYISIRKGIFFRLDIERIAGQSLVKLRIFNIPLSLSGGRQKTKNKKTKSGSAPTLALPHNLICNKAYQPLGKFISRLWHDFKPELLHIKGQYGFCEPHHTSWANMLLLLVSSESSHYKVQLEPVWDDEKLDIEGFLKGSITLAGIAWHLIRLVFSPPFWRFLRELSRDRKRKRIKISTAMQN
ncbi:MAG: hypothetical protein WC147_06110 [Syntrophomonas sp.]